MYEITKYTGGPRPPPHPPTLIWSRVLVSRPENVEGAILMHV